MSIKQIFGTGIAPGFSLFRRITSVGDLRVTSDGAVRVASIASPQVIFLRKTSAGDQRVTSTGERRITIDGLLGPQYFATAAVTSDGGEPYEVSYETNPWQPSAQGGENVFIWAFVTVSWSMAATIQITPFVEGETSVLNLPDGSTLALVPSTFVVAQQPGNLNRVSQMFPIPLVRRQMRGATEIARWYLRGERLQLLIESTGQLGIGELMVEGIEVEYEAVRKAQYAPVVTP